MDCGISKGTTSIYSGKGKGMKSEDQEEFMLNMRKLSVKMKQECEVNSKDKFKS